jgi:hypothetical protein
MESFASSSFFYCSKILVIPVEGYLSAPLAPTMIAVLVMWLYLFMFVYIFLSLYCSGAGRKNIAVCLGFNVCCLFVFFYIVLDIVLLAHIYISNKSLYLLKKVRRLRQKISFPQIRSMAGMVV